MRAILGEASVEMRRFLIGDWLLGFLLGIVLVAVVLGGILL